MGIMFDDIASTNSLTVRKRPLLTVDASCRSPGPNKRGKVFSSFPSAEADDLCQEYPTSDIFDTSCKPAYVDDPSVPTPADVSDDSIADDVTAMTPTMEDYASLFFGASELSFEEETKVDLVNAMPPRRSDCPPLVGAMTYSICKSNDLKKRRRRRVSFGAAIPTFYPLHDIPPSHAMTPEEKSTLWFSRADLDMLKSSAQRSIQDMRNRIMGKAQEYKDRSKFRCVMLTAEREINSSIRGLEHRVFRRRRTRQMLIRDVLQCQAHFKGLAQFGHNMDGEEKALMLAKVSMERSVKARSVAFVDGKGDYAEVYLNSCRDATDAANTDAPINKLQRQPRQVSV